MLAVGPTTMYVMLKASPEHGGALLHSLVPELSTVLASTTPGPLTVPVVHAPVWAEPSIQMFVNEGLAIKGPRVALVGFR